MARNETPTSVTRRFSNAGKATAVPSTSTASKGGNATSGGMSTLHYWFAAYEGKDDWRTKPVVLWLNGGPGCSSMDGLFLELGPLRVAPGSPNGKARLERRPSSWHRAAHALFLDQPVGTGFSRTSGRSYCRDDACIVNQFETFLARFVRSYKHLVMKDDKTSVPIFFAGESHAGHYIPHLAKWLADHGSTPSILSLIHI